MSAHHQSPVASSGRPQKRSSVGRATPVRTTKQDGIGGNQQQMRRRITAKRVALTEGAMDDIDTTLINHIATARLLSGEHIRRLQQANSQSEQRILRRRLQALHDQRVVTRIGRRVGGVRAGSDGYVYALDVVGQRIVDPQPRRQWRKPWTPSVRLMAHQLAVSELYVRLVELEQQGSIELFVFDTEPWCWRSFAGPGGAPMTLKPDAHVVLGHGDREIHAWIELDMATESLTWITQKAKTYGQYFNSGREQELEGVFPQCLWLTPEDNRTAGIADALARLPADHWHLHRVTSAERAIETLIEQQHVDGEQRS